MERGIEDFRSVAVALQVEREFAFGGHAWESVELWFNCCLLVEVEVAVVRYLH